MIRLRYMLVPALMLCCAPTLHAAMQQASPVKVSQRPTPRKKSPGKSSIQRLKAEVEKALTTRSEQGSAIYENKIDSIIYKANDNATKTTYTYDKEGNLVTETEYFKSATSNDYVQSSSVYYGPGGEHPAYEIVTQNDVDNALRTRYEYDWTPYASINDEVNPSPWNNCTLVQEEVNGQWKTTQTCTPEFKDGRLMSLTYAKLNSDDALENTYRVTYQYDSDGKLVKVNYEDFAQDETMAYDIKYNADGKLLWYGKRYVVCPI